jgi:mannose-6-phosphate isomerase-like protein (cupin superfamily)
MKGYVGPIEKLTLENENFREVLFTGKFCQLVVMSIKPGEDIGMEVHEHVDQFFRIDAGQAKVVMDGEESEVGDGDAIVVPAGTEHNVVNISDKDDLKLYTIYSPPNHPEGTVHKTKKEAEEAEKNEH